MTTTVPLTHLDIDIVRTILGTVGLAWGCAISRAAGGDLSLDRPSSFPVAQPLFFSPPPSPLPGEYRISSADINFKEDATAEQLIDVIEGKAAYIPAIYVLNKIDQISVEEVRWGEKMPFHNVHHTHTHPPRFPPPALPATARHDLQNSPLCAHQRAPQVEL
jgi:hypothetical protein